jgi:tetraacyldisaccharide 4'-kinase
VTFVQSLIWPLSVLYATAGRFRAWSFRAGLRRTKRLNGTMISVGNLTVGGTGKTPMVCWLAARAVAEGMQVGILTRGYHGTAGSSDEIEVLRNRLGNAVRIGVGADRYAKGKELESVGTNWFILDDGFQHLQLFRDVDIVLIDAANPFGGGHLLPAGRLREPLSALHRADLVVIMRSSHAPAVETVVRRFTAVPVFYAQTKLEGIFSGGQSKKKSEGVEEITSGLDRKYFAFCGIGNPKAFFADLERWKTRIVGTAVFRDHHRFTQQDMETIERRARAAGGEALLCTEKDIANLKDVRASELPLFYCRISLDINEAEQFWKTVNEQAGSRREQVAR